MSREVLLKIKDLKTYAENNGRFLRIVDGVSFDIKENEVVALFGECGCGKTTTASSIMGIVRYMPGVVGGEIYLKCMGNLLEGLDKSKNMNRWKKEYERRMEKVRGRKLFLVMQGAKSSLNPFWTARRQVEKVSNSGNVEDIFEKLCIGGKMERFPHQLSGGECQRVLLAMALATQPELLIIDEPTVGIDEELMKEIIDLLIEYKKQHSILLISHDIKVVQNLADRVVVMCRRGRIVESGNKDEIIYTPKHPYTKMLIESFKIPENKDEPLSTITLLDKGNNGCRFYSRCEEDVKDEICLIKRARNDG